MSIVNSLTESLLKCADPEANCDGCVQGPCRIGAPCMQNLMREAAWMIDALSAKARPGWISVDDKLPDNDDHVLCSTLTKAGRRNVVIGYYMDGNWRCGMNSNVTHWMPMPEPPEVMPDD